MRGIDKTMERVSVRFCVYGMWILYDYTRPSAPSLSDNTQVRGQLAARAVR